MSNRTVRRKWNKRFRGAQVIKPAVLTQTNQFLKQKQPRLYQLNELPLWMQKSIVDAHLELLPDDNERAKIVLLILHSRRLISSTARKLYNMARQLFFPTSTYKVNNLEFDNLKPAQLRFESFDHIKKIFTYCISSAEHESEELFIFVLFMYYSGLRPSETLNISVQILEELQRKSPKILYHRKTSSEWYPVYNTHLNKLVTELLEKFQHLPPNTVIWKKSYMQLKNDLRKLYSQLFGESPPIGFGLHHFRYYAASNLFAQNQIHLAQKYLGHNDRSSIYRYFKNDKCELSKKLTEHVKIDNFYRDLIQ